MASPIPNLRMVYPRRGIITCASDLEYINQKLLRFRFFQTKAVEIGAGQGRAVGSTVGYPGSSMVEPTASAETVLSKSLKLVCPDRNILCDSPDCPIKGIPHNLGRYYHNGGRARDPSDLNFETSLGSMDEVSNTFNRTVPPPEIVTAYIRTCANLATQAELDIVRQYKKHHIWSSINTEPSTPWPREAFPHLHGLYGDEEYSDGLVEVVSNDGSKYVETRMSSQNANEDSRHVQGQVRLSQPKSLTRPSHAVESEEMDNEDDEEEDQTSRSRTGSYHTSRFDDSDMYVFQPSPLHALRLDDLDSIPPPMVSNSVIQGPDFDKSKFPTRPLCASDFEDSDDGDSMTYPPNGLSDIEEDDESIRPLIQTDSDETAVETCNSDDERLSIGGLELNEHQDTFFQTLPVNSGATREVPHGRELMTVQLRLQERMLRQMAYQAIQDAEKGYYCTRQDGLCLHNDDPKDRALEIILELMESLPKALQDGGFQAMLLDDKHFNGGFSDAEFTILCDVHIILQKAFSDMIANATRPYRPTGKPVTSHERRNQFRALLTIRDQILGENPGKSIARYLRTFRTGEALFKAPE